MSPTPAVTKRRATSLIFSHSVALEKKQNLHPRVELFTLILRTFVPPPSARRGDRNLRFGGTISAGKDGHEADSFSSSETSRHAAMILLRLVHRGQAEREREIENARGDVPKIIPLIGQSRCQDTHMYI